jgi:hypothetical protein
MCLKILEKVRAKGSVWFFVSKFVFVPFAISVAIVHFIGVLWGGWFAWIGYYSKKSETPC